MVLKDYGGATGQRVDSDLPCVDYDTVFGVDLKGST